MPAVSVVIPLYNKECYIKRAVASVLAQTYHNFELIVVDDGSTDQSAEIVRSIGDSRIRLIQQVNAGVSAARNRGISNARSDFIAFLDSDDEWLPCHLETLLRLREEYPGAGIYSAATKWILPNGDVLFDENRAIPPPPWEGYLPSYFRAAAEFTSINSSSVGIPKKIFKELGGFLEGVQHGEDTEMWGRIALLYPVVFTWKICAIYHRDAESTATSVWDLQTQQIPKMRHPFIPTAVKALEADEVPDHMKSDLMKAVAIYETQAISHNIRIGDIELAKKMIDESIIQVGLFDKIFWYNLKWRVLALIPKRVFHYMQKTGLCC